MLNGNLKVAVNLQVEYLALNLQSKTAYSLSQFLEAGTTGRQAKKQQNHWRFPTLQSAAQHLPDTLLLHLLLINIYLVWYMGTGERKCRKASLPLTCKLFKQ